MVNDNGPLESRSNTITQNSSGVQGLSVTATQASGASRISSVDTSGESVTTTESHNYSTGDAVTMYSPGSVPGGLSGSTTYYVKVTANNSFHPAHHQGRCGGGHQRGGPHQCPKRRCLFSG